MRTPYDVQNEILMHTQYIFFWNDLCGTTGVPRLRIFCHCFQHLLCHIKAFENYVVLLNSKALTSNHDTHVIYPSTISGRWCRYGCCGSDASDSWRLWRKGFMTVGRWQSDGTSLGRTFLVFCDRVVWIRKVFLFLLNDAFNMLHTQVVIQAVRFWINIRIICSELRRFKFCRKRSCPLSAHVEVMKVFQLHRSDSSAHLVCRPPALKIEPTRHVFLSTYAKYQPRCSVLKVHWMNLS